MSVSSDGSILEQLSDLDMYVHRLADLPLPTDRSGTMWKRGRGQHFSFIRPWAKREFVLDASSKKFEYRLPGDGTLAGGQGAVKGSVILDASSSVKPTPNSTLPRECTHGFEILTSMGNVELGVESEAEQKAWIQAIQLCVQGDAISEAKIQKKIYDDHVRRKEEREERKQKEAETLLEKALMAKGAEKVSCPERLVRASRCPCRAALVALPLSRCPCRAFALFARRPLLASPLTPLQGSAEEAKHTAS